MGVGGLILAFVGELDWVGGIFLILGAAVGLALLIAFTLGFSGSMAALFGKGSEFRERLSVALKPWQTFVIGTWYVFHLIGAALFTLTLFGDLPKGAFATTATNAPASVIKLEGGTNETTGIVSKPDLKSDQANGFFWKRLKLFREEPIAFAMAICFVCGSVGATLYGVLWLSKSRTELHNEWLLRRHILLPLLGGFLGTVSYLFVKAGSFTLQAGSSNDQMRLNFGVYCVAFLAGFASRELTAKLTQIAENVFTKVDDLPAQPEGQKVKPSDPSAGISQEKPK